MLVSLCAIAALAVAGYVVSHGQRIPDAGQIPSLPASITSVPSTTPVAVTTTASDSPLVTAFLGDDWTLGTGASSKSKGFVPIVCKALNLVEHNFAADGTGYAKSSGSDGPYSSRLDAVVAAHPQVVIVSGGRNDVSDDPGTADDAAKALFKDLHQRLPDAKIIVIAPMWGDSGDPPELLAFAAKIKSAVLAVGGSYVVFRDPLYGHPSWMADAADPNDQGYAALASALVSRLGPLLRAT